LEEYGEWRNIADLLIQQFCKKPQGYEWLAKLHQHQSEFLFALKQWELAFNYIEKAPRHYFTSQIQCEKTGTPNNF